MPSASEPQASETTAGPLPQGQATHHLPLRIDGTPVVLAETLTVEQRRKEGDKWTVELFRGPQQQELLLELTPLSSTLYRRVAPEQVPPPETIVWTDGQNVTVQRTAAGAAVHSGESQRAGAAGAAGAPATRGRRAPGQEQAAEAPQPELYRRGQDQHGERYLELGTTLWLLDDAVVPYGPQDRWWARARTPARHLTPYRLADARALNRPPGAGSWLLVALVLAWGLADLTVTSLGFRWPFWIVGLLLLLAAGLTACGRTTLVLAGAFGGWLMTSGLAPALTTALPALEWLSAPQAHQAWAMVLLASFAALGLLTHRLFYVVADAAAKGGLTMVLLYSLGLLAVAWIDEDVSWLGGWTSYLRSAPYLYIWPAFWIAFLIYYGRDYRRVPLTRKGVNALQRRIGALLQGEHPLGRAGQLGALLDDLHDAIHLSNDGEVRGLEPYRQQLERASHAFRELARSGLTPQQLEPVLPRLVDDLHLLAQQVSEMRPGAEGLRLSPTLQLLALTAGDHMQWLEQQARSAHRAAPFR